MARRKDNKPSVRTLKRTLDTLWSLWIRQSEAGPDGMASCCSCGQRHHWKEMDCGHFVSRNHNSGRFDVRNTHAQCKKCNRFREGNKAGYAVYLQKKYGPDILNDLNQLQYKISRFTPEELQARIRDIRDALKEKRYVSK